MTVNPLNLWPGSLGTGASVALAYFAGRDPNYPTLVAGAGNAVWQPVASDTDAYEWVEPYDAGGGSRVLNADGSAAILELATSALSYQVDRYGYTYRADGGDATPTVPPMSFSHWYRDASGNYHPDLYVTADFENGQPPGWVAVTRNSGDSVDFTADPTLAGSPTGWGDQCLRCTVDSSGYRGLAYAQLGLVTLEDAVSVTFEVEPIAATFNSENVYVARLLDLAGNTLAVVYADSSSVLHVDVDAEWDAVAGTWGTPADTYTGGASSFVPAGGTTYEITLEWDRGNDQCVVKVDGSTVDTLSLNTSLTGTPWTLRLGHDQRTAADCDLTYDAVAVTRLVQDGDPAYLLIEQTTGTYHLHTFA